MPINWRDHIVSTPDILRGKPRIIVDSTINFTSEM